MQGPNKQTPFQVLGNKLRSLRENRNENLAEVAGAVEISPEKLSLIEDGTEQPTEDILMLLISYFDLKETEAVKLWESAGYSKSFSDDRRRIVEESLKSAIVLLAMDIRTMYSDDVDVVGGDKGVVLNFNQQGTSANSQIPVAKVGMSYEQAFQLSETLSKVLLRHKYMKSHRELPPPSNIA